MSAQIIQFPKRIPFVESEAERFVKLVRDAGGFPDWDDEKLRRIYRAFYQQMQELGTPLRSA